MAAEGFLVHFAPFFALRPFGRRVLGSVIDSLEFFFSPRWPTVVCHRGLALPSRSCSCVDIDTTRFVNQRQKQLQQQSQPQSHSQQQSQPQFLRHERQTVAMELAAPLHHRRDVGPGLNDGLRAQTTASSGTRPGVLRRPRLHAAANCWRRRRRRKESRQQRAEAVTEQFRLLLDRSKRKRKKRRKKKLPESSSSRHPPCSGAAHTWRSGHLPTALRYWLCPARCLVAA